MLDLDGTTIPNKSDGRPSQKVIKTIKIAREKLHVGAVTGRPYIFAKDIMQDLSLSGPSIVSGGGMIIDPSSEEILWRKPIDSENIEKVYKLLKEVAIPFWVKTENVENEITKGTNEQFSISIRDIPEEKAYVIENKLKNIPQITMHKLVGWKSGTVWLQVTHIDATKQYGIFEVAKILGIRTHEIIGVGDGYNDFPLLMACGLRVAMGNAVPELKAIADYVAPTVEDDGVADVIEKFIL